MLMLETCFSNVTLWIYESKTPQLKFFEKCTDYFRDLYLYSEPNRAVPEQLPKYKYCNCVENSGKMS